MLGRELLRVPGRVAGPGERADRYVMGADVVGVAIASEFVVGGDDVGLVSTDEPDQAPRRLVEVGLPEAARVEVPRPTHHVGIAVAEVLPLGHAEDAHGPFQLTCPGLSQAAVVVGRVHGRHDDLALLAAGACDQDHAMAGGHGLGHRTPGPDRLVVGMGMDGHQRGPVRGGRLGSGRCGVGVGHRFGILSQVFWGGG